MTRGRRWLFVTVALVTTLGGCAATAGDGKLVDDWPVMASASPQVPPAGVCYASSIGHASQIDPTLSDKLPCTTPHIVETFHVGQFPAEVAALPPIGHPDYVRAFGECEAKAKEFLGGDWYNGRVYLNITVPLARQWEGGGRWYRCEATELKFLYSDEILKRESSIAGGLAGAAPLAMRCGDLLGVTDDGFDDIAVVDCAQPHDVEYAGAFNVPGTEEPAGDKTKQIYAGCWDVVAGYLGGSRNRIQVGYVAWGARDKGWQRGDHRVRCFAWSDERKMVGSVKGIGNAAPRRS
jgi:hypothetical protein